ncbi:probable E3 ubiquitin-protein ligase RNF144A-A [Strongylocentrotus purpuratus]|uniref:RBR-type E3 ubiquitin transferase n=1 Tax=Strongylocentrotus purpuratus TaxID=7668 RepID=A0A7M7HEX7_STRPU|nr:probable E3 ubiquitin-protein ligase RNF144A-A [Strongylocentrotus purpuratus]
MAGKEAFCMSNPLQPENSPDAIRTSTSLRTLSLNDETKSLSDQGCCSTSTTSDENSFPDVSLPSSSWRTLSLDEQLLRGRGRGSSSQRPPYHEHCCRRVSSCQTISGNLALDPMITCKLCLCECKLHEMHQMHRCSCIYCKKCLEQYLVVLTEEGAVSIVTCPDAACKEHGRIADEEIQLLVDDALFERFKKVKFMKEVELDPGRAWCPRVGCNTVCRQTEKEKEKQEEERRKVKGKKLIRINGKKFNCSKCGLTFCSICKAPWHGGRPCSKLSRGGTGSTSGKSRGTSHILDMLGIQKDDSDEVSIKRCPFCHIPIERDAGCAQMMCKNCQHVFCWYCLANLDNDFLLRHYDKGPCKNKLGHSRTTVIFHRAQIVCVFAGFGFLLLIASPFLLLVAPCILCCKSKWGNMCDDIDEIPES